MILSQVIEDIFLVSIQFILIILLNINKLSIFNLKYIIYSLKENKKINKTI